ncbi:6-phosphofructokinase [Salibacterium qingdaonense]|uniref:Phosphofructokinase n=1 Tax=Salibacterium qingdaonense TaxID=266892 RepID=A0A1I4I4L0_9BACI|nr:6-phosphofructokinase [Salibacterium qingdaonense]SFL49057.1 Phosphofructokinase [Salibacterium qingdaonense]
MSVLPSSFLHFFAGQLCESGSTWNMVLPGRFKAEWHPFDPERFARSAPFSPMQLKQWEVAETLQAHADMVLLLTDPLTSEEELQQFLKEIGQPVFMLPVSIFYPIIRESESIGYDTALNEIVQYALRVSDTADSMKYDNPRLFFLQLPDGASLHLTEDTALCTGGLKLNSADEQSMQHFTRELEHHYQSGHTFALAAVEESVDLAEVQKRLPQNRSPHVNVVTVDSAQCLGPKFTAKDRLLMVRAARKADEWRRSSLKASHQVEWFHITA